jgi:hypothetical protein
VLLIFKILNNKERRFIKLNYLIVLAVGVAAVIVFSIVLKWIDRKLHGELPDKSKKDIEKDTEDTQDKK